MKKLIVLAAVAAMAMGVQAESTTWSWCIDSEGAVLKEPGNYDVLLPSATAYIFASKTGGSGATVSQASLVDAFAAGTLNLAEMGALDHQPLIDGVVSWKSPGTFTYDAEATEFFFALVDNSLGRERLFISTGDNSTGGDYDGTNIGFIGAFSDSSGENFDFVELDSAGGYKGDSWYGRAAAAPEPTSGLLLLLGVAGLALKRRRA